MRRQDQRTSAELNRDTRIRDAQDVVISRMKKDPARARSTIRADGHVGDGLACRVTQGKFEAVLDLGPGMGGDAAGPSPGFFGRAAIVGCVAIAIKMLAAREGLVFRTVDVSVETDFDDSALFGIGDTSAAPIETRIDIRIAAAADETVVNDVVDRALRMDPWFLALRDPQCVRASVSLLGNDARD